MELQTIFEKFEVLTDEELMEVSGGTGVNGNHLYPYLLNEDQTNFLDLYNLDGSGR
ncbi:bacteriocin class II family protein [Lactococcus lactis]|uniref:bacteriocin class II family protein n=1 Tax=Lactococcus lactis TaxID=1358 RepID=UPI0018AAAC33|nr:bacteriocin class II family protein [Lactococcus lactis]